MRELRLTGVEAATNFVSFTIAMMAIGNALRSLLLPAGEEPGAGASVDSSALAIATLSPEDCTAEGIQLEYLL